MQRKRAVCGEEMPMFAAAVFTALKAKYLRTDEWRRMSCIFTRGMLCGP
jgi:hypothetical protein